MKANQHGFQSWHGKLNTFVTALVFIVVGLMFIGRNQGIVDPYWFCVIVSWYSWDKRGRGENQEGAYTSADGFVMSDNTFGSVQQIVAFKGARLNVRSEERFSTCDAPNWIARVELFGKETYQVRLKNGAYLRASNAGYRLLKERLSL